jgi:hypothetical protein
MKRKPEIHLPYFTALETFQKARGRAMCELEADAARLTSTRSYTSP